MLDVLGWPAIVASPRSRPRRLHLYSLKVADLVPALTVVGTPPPHHTTHHNTSRDKVILAILSRCRPTARWRAAREKKIWTLPICSLSTTSPTRPTASSSAAYRHPHDTSCLSDSLSAATPYSASPPCRSHPGPHTHAYNKSSQATPTVPPPRRTSAPTGVPRRVPRRVPTGVPSHTHGSSSAAHLRRAGSHLFCLQYHLACSSGSVAAAGNLHRERDARTL
jgi:hypothetical protein